MPKRRKRNKFKEDFLIIGAFCAILGCGVFVGNPADDDEGTSEANTIEGSVVLGSVEGATVNIYRLSASGVRDGVLVTTTTNQDGTFSASYTYTGAIEVVAVGGTYTDESTGDLVSRNSTDEIRSIYSTPPTTHMAVNALTEITASYALENVGDGLESGLANATTLVGELFGVSDIDFSTVRPADLTSGDSSSESSQAKTLGLVMAGFSQAASDAGVGPSDLGTMIKDLGRDLSDGALDQKVGSDDLNSTLSVTPNAIFNGFSSALDTFVSGERNKSDLDASPVLEEPPVPLEEGEYANLDYVLSGTSEEISTPLSNVKECFYNSETKYFEGTFTAGPTKSLRVKIKDASVESGVVICSQNANNSAQYDGCLVSLRVPGAESYDRYDMHNKSGQFETWEDYSGTCEISWTRAEHMTATILCSDLHRTMASGVIVDHDESKKVSLDVSSFKCLL
ncbi:hypothetical protein N9W79_01060 [bacterium]|nr:hypothetical protein [bacterium]